VSVKSAAGRKSLVGFAPPAAGASTSETPRTTSAAEVASFSTESLLESAPKEEDRS